MLGMSQEDRIATAELLDILEQRMAAIEFRQERFRVILSEILELFDEQITETRRRLSERLDTLEENRPEA